MYKNIIAGLLVICCSFTAQAGLIVTGSPITGADMAGIEVTAHFGDGNFETQVWSTLTTDASVPFGEGFSGGVTGAGWSLNQQGFTFGNTSPVDGSILGLWTLSNLGVASGIVGFDIAALPGLIAFDIDFDVDVTPNSGAGIGFVTPTPNTTSAYSDQVNPLYNDLFGTLKVSLDGQAPLSINQQFLFIADTEKLAVPEPSTIAMMLAGLFIAAVRIKRRK